MIIKSRGYPRGTFPPPVSDKYGHRNHPHCGNCTFEASDEDFSPNVVLQRCHRFPPHPNYGFPIVESRECLCGEWRSFAGDSSFFTEATRQKIQFENIKEAIQEFGPENAEEENDEKSRRQ